MARGAAALSERPRAMAREARKDRDADHTHVLWRTHLRGIALARIPEAKRGYMIQALAKAIDPRGPKGRNHVAAIAHEVAPPAVDHIAAIHTDHGLDALGRRVAHDDDVAVAVVSQHEGLPPVLEGLQRAPVCGLNMC